VVSYIKVEHCYTFLHNSRKSKTGRNNLQITIFVDCNVLRLQILKQQKHFLYHITVLSNLFNQSSAPFPKSIQQAAYTKCPFIAHA